MNYVAAMMVILFQTRLVNIVKIKRLEAPEISTVAYTLQAPATDLPPDIDHIQPLLSGILMVMEM